MHRTFYFVLLYIRILGSGKSGKMAKKYQHHKFPSCLGNPSMRERTRRILHTFSDITLLRWIGNAFVILQEMPHAGQSRVRHSEIADRVGGYGKDGGLTVLPVWLLSGLVIIALPCAFVVLLSVCVCSLCIFAACRRRYALYIMCHHRDTGRPQTVSAGKSMAKWRLRYISMKYCT